MVPNSKAQVKIESLTMQNEASTSAKEAKINKEEFRRLGNILLDGGLVTISDIERILHKQKNSNLRFGDAAIELSLISQDELDRALFQQFSYAQLNPKTSKVSREVIAAFAPHSEQVEGLRALRSQLLLRWFSEEQKTLSIVSVDDKEGKSYISANLAVLFAQIGEKTLLIDGNMREPRQHEIFNISNNAGLSTILSGRDGHPVCRQIDEMDSLHVLASGPTPPNPQELISSAKFAQVIAALKDTYDTILIDTPAIKQNSDAIMITSKIDGALVVTRRNHARLADIKAMKQNMEESGVVIAGSILNM